jgi:hypothetical protein
MQMIRSKLNCNGQTHRNMCVLPLLLRWIVYLQRRNASNTITSANVHSSYAWNHVRSEKLPCSFWPIASTKPTVSGKGRHKLARTLYDCHARMICNVLPKREWFVSRSATHYPLPNFDLSVLIFLRHWQSQKLNVYGTWKSLKTLKIFFHTLFCNSWKLASTPYLITIYYFLLQI